MSLLTAIFTYSRGDWLEVGAFVGIALVVTLFGWTKRRWRKWRRSRLSN